MKTTLLIVCWEKNGYSDITEMPMENGCIAAVSLRSTMGSTLYLPSHLFLTSTNEWYIDCA